jgi:hypothetical protein
METMNQKMSKALLVLTPNAEWVLTGDDYSNIQWLSDNINKPEPYDFADQLRLLARLDKRISYIIFNGKIASYKRNYKWRKYTGINPHNTHIHISFTAKGDLDGSMFEIPILTGEPLHGTTKASKRKLGKKLLGSWNSNLSSGGLGSSTHCKCCTCGKPSSNPSLVKS